MNVPVSASDAATLKVAIVGSGPSGFYAAEELLQSGQPVEVTMIERLPVPYGLVRSGVAPDHPKLKQSILVYERIARLPGFHYFGNTEVGGDLSVEDLRATHHCVIFANGAAVDQKLNIPGEHLAGSHSATEFVGWYNGHPDYRACSFDFDQEVVAIIGQGNVALDVARILAKPVDELRQTDIAEHALDALARSRIREIHLFGRRGPAQAKFTASELAELGRIPCCTARANPDDLVLSEPCRQEVADKMSRNIAKNVEVLQGFAGRAAEPAGRSCHFHFFRNPVSFLGTRRVEGLRLARTVLSGEAFQQVAASSGEVVDFPCGLVFRSIGYRGRPIPGLPFDERTGVLRHAEGRLCDEAGRPLHGLYATGWIKRGPSGIIGTNRADSLATVATLRADLPRIADGAKPGADGVASKLRACGTRYVTFEGWSRIDAAEVSRGQPKGKPREKFTRVEEMLLAA